MVVRKIFCIDYSKNWATVFAKKTLENGDTLVVEQAEWKDISLVTSSESGVTLLLKAADNPFPFTKQKEERTLENPDMILIRNFPTDLHGINYKKIIMGLMMAGIPSVNSLSSIFMSMNRVVLYGEMKRATERAIKRLPDSSYEISAVPLIYHPNQGTRVVTPNATPNFPAVMKAGDTHAGYGKMRVHHKSDEDDLCSILALNNDYYTLEPLVKYEFEYRIQKIGDKIRCFRRNNNNRTSTETPSQDWKNNWGNLVFENHPCLPHHIAWIEECAKIFGGLDICALDVLHSEGNKEVALELNDTACGLMWEHEAEDNLQIAKIVLDKMNALFC